ncbi:hypothetical protein [Actinomadura chokoriensis]|uniref:hypothetical protein n=1 Tax=Actinomadura chokoriensis TaxID=454156 RepID=UPI0031F7B917
MTDESEKSPKKRPIDRDHRAKRRVRRRQRRQWRWRWRGNVEVALLAWHSVLVAVATWEAWPFH